jgi:glutamine kinase
MDVHFMIDVFTSKADVLKYLSNKLIHSKIEKLFDFTISEWNNNDQKILQEITKKFNSTIIIRSSALGEDSMTSSKAGEFLSVMNVNPECKNEVSKNINMIINSYKKLGSINVKHKILVQEQSTNIIKSGVVFTRDESGSPYYVINFEEGSSTDGVTQGKINNVIKILKNTDHSKLTTHWSQLLTSVKEIETLLTNHSLDIEFGINSSGEIIIFQVRPLVLIKEKFSKNLDQHILDHVDILKNQVKNLNKSSHVSGSSTILSDMSDWNPAEILGNQSNLLDYSLYDYLIMDKIWHQSRTKIGYQNIDPYPLMTRIGKKPYVDLRGSFNSLLPNTIQDPLKTKLINFFFKKLKTSKYLHDKIEFDIVFSCYELSLEKRLNELLDHGFTADECSDLKNSLKIFTNNLIKQFPSLVLESNQSIEILKGNNNKIIKNFEKSSKSFSDYIIAIKLLLDDCKNFGTLPFSTMARLAFVSTAMMKSLVDNEIVNEKEIQEFMYTINTPLSKLREDFVSFSNKKMRKKDFFLKYGHLRPGTYDITATRYDKHDHFPSTLKFITKPTQSDKSLNDEFIKNAFQLNGIYFDETNFSKFVTQSIILREELKFHFTKNLSDALEIISLLGEKLGFSREDMSNLNINQIFDSQSLSKTELKKSLTELIQSEKVLSNITEKIILPSLIIDEKDLEIITFVKSKPNFISDESISGEIINLSKSKKQSISGKIIIIENADPGYDWIFTENPLALITKYGGVASHMAIRCAEINLPAAIGVGDLIFEKFFNAKKILLDCKNEKIIILEQSNYDEDTEVEKTLKSIGYIK